MILIAQNRKLDMLDVLSHPLGPLPWSLAGTDGVMKKTNKAVLAKHLESKVSPAEVIPGQYATVIDAMAVIQKVSGENRTFDELSDLILKQMLHHGQTSSRIDVVFDVYRDQSIKTAERENRGSHEGVVFSQIRPGHKIKNWRRLLACSESKDNFTKFLAESWKDEKKRQTLGDKVLLVTSGDKCFRLTKNDWQIVHDLTSNHEEADTRILLHAKHAAENYPSVVCVTDDTDVFVICLGFSKFINCKLFIRRGPKSRVRLVDISKLAAALGDKICSALLGLHSWTGCDTVSALAGQGKLKALKLVSQNEKYRTAFSKLGAKWELSNEVLDIIEEFTCQLYFRQTKLKKVNELRYEMFRSRKGDVESGQLPPCQNTLVQHTLRANYQSAIWRRCLENWQDIPDPNQGHGWKTSETKIW